jgi:hypothetical protein
MTHTFRFVNNILTTVSNNYIIGAGNLLDLYCVSLTTMNNSLFRLISSCQIKRIRIFGQQQVNSNQPQAISLTWLGNTTVGGREVVITDIGSGTMVPYLDSRPPADSAAAMWNNSYSTGSSSTILFAMNLNGGCIVDLELDIVFVCTPLSEAVPTSSSGASSTTYGPCAVFFKALDGGTGPNLIPPQVPNC